MSAARSPRPWATTSNTESWVSSGTSCTRRATCTPVSRQTMPASGASSPLSDLHQGGLAGAVPADERDALAGLDLQRHVVEQRQVAVGVGDMVERERGAWLGPRRGRDPSSVSGLAPFERRDGRLTASSAPWCVCSLAGPGPTCTVPIRPPSAWSRMWQWIIHVPGPLVEGHEDARGRLHRDVDRVLPRPSAAAARPCSSTTMKK